MSIIPKQNANLSAGEKRALLAQLLREKVNESKSLFPLSQGQQALWFLYKLVPHSWAYNTLFTARIQSSVDIPALRRTFQALITRHLSLRTTYTERDGKPFGQIHEDVELQFDEIDASTWKWDELKQQVTQEAHRPFNLEQGSVMRVSLFTRSPKDHILMLAIHHIASDFWSLLILMDELRVLYSAEKAGTQASLPPQNLSYVDYVHWQNQMLAGSAGERLWAYWREQLAGELPVINLPTDRPRSPVQTYQGASHSFRLTEELAQRLKGLAQAEKATLYMTLLAAFQVLLYRYTGQEEILVGSPTFGRTQREFAEIVGYFVNPVVLRANLAGNPTFQAFLSQVRQTVLGAIGHQDYPFLLLVERLQPNRDRTRSPIFQVLFALQKPQQFEEVVELFAPSKTASQVNWGELKLESFEIPQQEGQFDLTLEMIEAGESLFGVFKYNTDLFEAETITRMSGHFQTLLEAIAIAPQQRVSQFPLLSEPERHQLLVEWNDTQVDYPKDVCVHQLFEAQSEQTPEAVAVVFEGQQLTYRELNRRANQVAHHLRSLGVGPDGLVGICVERSLDMVVGLLGILKAGGAYVPLDPDYPSERLAYMLSDSQVPVLLTQEKLMSRLSEHQARVVCLDRDSGVTLTENEENPVSGVKPENLAYVIYTSGSTGKPKGVLVTHQGLCNLGAAQIRLFDLHSDSRVLQFASFSFDASIWEIVMALCSGAMLCLGTRESLLPGPTLMKFLLEHAITHMTLPPSALATLPTEELPALQKIIVAGEACSTGLVTQWSKDRRFFNAYGPTESTVCATVYECPNGSHKLPIGRPIINTQVYILDPHLQPVPVGVPGELYIGGAGLARGYLNRPELTSEKFIFNPFSEEPGARLYKTGDLARYLSDGNIEFLGRLDDQVKIRGFRIEPGEIEALLGHHPAVQETVVMVREDVPGNKRLVAYVVVNQLAAPTIPKLQQFLKQKLPEYMVPSAFVLLSALPLTPNGKIDRRALPAPDMTRPELAGTYVAPRTSVEELLAGIWADVLRLEKVGIHDNFFELGGDSILSIQVVARANQAGLSLTSKQLFGYQTIVELATVAGTTSVFQAEQGLVTGEVLLTPIQRWFFEQEFAEPHHWNQAMLLEVPPTLDMVLLSQLVQQLLVHHDALRLRFMRSASGWQQVNALPDEAVSCTKVDLSVLLEAEQGSAIEATAAELQASLNLSEGPLVRVALFYLGPNQPSRLLFIIHHLVVDGVSWRILLEDLQTGYQQLSSGLAISLPPKTTSFQGWAHQLSEYAQSTVLEQELDYWLAQSRFWIAPLPRDYPQGKDANIAASASNVVVSLSSLETRALLQDVQQAYNTQINDVLLTALAQVFAQYLGTQYLMVDLEGHGREEIFSGVDVSRTVGWFTTIFPVLLELRETEYPGSALKSVKEQLRHIPNRGIGYGLLRYLKENAAITEKLRRLPQAEVSFNYLGQLDQVLSPDSMFQIAKESRGPERSRLGNRHHLLEVDAFVSGGQLKLYWTYSSNLHQRATIESLAQGFLTALRALIAHCQSPEAGGYTPSDFPLTQMSQDALDTTFTSIEFEEG